MCAFCDFTIFVKKEAFNHLASHFECFNKCSICNNYFKDTTTYVTHGCKLGATFKSFNEEDSERIGLWIDDFLAFQEDERFHAMKYQDINCFICKKLPNSNHIKFSGKSAHKTAKEHIRCHLAYYRFSCNLCRLKPFRCFDTRDLTNHLSEIHQIENNGLNEYTDYTHEYSFITQIEMAIAEYITN